ncbi:MAG: ORF6N domain-containing protein [Nitrospirae bacterium]|nr:ORF6N domain-containing protein [Nitrospirota bacterium]
MTKALNQAVKRNGVRFPGDFLFQLTQEEFTALRFQIGISNTGRGGRRYRPYAFTEHGAIMAANVLNSEQTVLPMAQVMSALGSA